MKPLCVVLLASSLVASCTGREEPSPHGQQPPREPPTRQESPAEDASAHAQPPALYTSETVIFVGPDSARMQRLKERMGPDFYVAADDENWYRAQAFTLLDSLGIAHTSADRGTMRFLVGGQQKAYTWDDVRSAWFVVLYDGESEPVVSHSIDLRADIGHLRP